MAIDQPQPGATSSPDGANGLATYFGVIFSPGEAFETLARVPMWGWACILGLVILVLADIVGMPATVHTSQLIQQVQLAQTAADQQQTLRDAYSKIGPFLPIIVVVQSLVFIWIFWLIFSLVALGGAAVGGGVASFRNAWVLTLNSNLIALLGQLVNYVILRLQGTDNLTKMSDLFTLPSLAMVVHGDAKLSAFLYAFNIFNIWYFAVIAFGAQKLMKVGSIAAWAIALVVALILGLIGMAVAR